MTLGNGTTYNGASVASEAVTAPAHQRRGRGVRRRQRRGSGQRLLCFTAADNGGDAVLDPAKVAGKIVVCDRGVNARINKSLAVQEAGGVGVILVNTSTNSINADFHFVPTVHLQADVRTAVKTYADTAGATATINQATIVYDAAAPFTASFSSRGPLLAGGGDLLKPDVIAPGQDILAAVAPPGQHGLDFSLLSGTSMSSPHVAGLAALFKDLKPGWSPMAIKSALMTTGTDILDGPNTNPLVIFRQGAGHVNPNGATDPGLVFDAGWNDWLAFLCGTTAAVNPASCTALEGAGYSLDASDYNGASIAIGNLAGIQTVTRTVTNVSDDASTYDVQPRRAGRHHAPTSPTRSRSIRARARRSRSRSPAPRATLNAYVGGQLTLSDGEHDVRVPVVIRPVALAAPAEVHSDGEDISYDVTFGYDGAFTATAARPRAGGADRGHRRRRPDRQHLLADLAERGQARRRRSRPGPRTPASRCSTRTSTPAPTSTCACSTGPTLVGSSGSGTSAEEVNLLNPAAATYTVVVQGWGVVGSSPYVLHTWLLGSTDAGNMDGRRPVDRRDRRDRHDRPQLHRPHRRYEVPGLGGVRRLRRHAEPDDRAGRPLAIHRRRPRRRPHAARGPRHPPGASSRLGQFVAQLVGGGFSHQRTSLLLVLAR